MENLLTPEQVAEILAVNVETVRRYCREGKIKFIKMSGRLIRISPEDLKAFLKGIKQ